MDEVYCDPKSLIQKETGKASKEEWKMGVHWIRFQQMVSRIFIALVALCFIGQPLEVMAATGHAQKHSSHVAAKTKSTHAKSSSKGAKKSSRLPEKRKAGKTHGNKVTRNASKHRKVSTAKASTKKGTHGGNTGIFTEYTSREGAGHGKTADGTPIKSTSGCIVANNHLPLGTKINVEGIGTCEVRDRLPGKKRGDHFDIHVKAHPKQARKFGKQRLKYTVISEPRKG